MAYSYFDTARMIALRAKQFTDGDAAAREAAYNSATLSAQLDGIDVPYTALKKDILATARELAVMVGNSNNPQYRRHISASSSNVADKGQIPLNDSSGFEFIGTWGGVYDSSNDHPLRKQPNTVVVNRIDNPNSFFKAQSYMYCFEDTTVRHTRTNVVFRGCSWDQATQVTAYDANGNCPLPQELQVLHACMVLEILPQEGWFVTESQLYSNLVTKRKLEIIEGKIKIMQMPVAPKPER